MAVSGAMLHLGSWTIKGIGANQSFQQIESGAYSVPKGVASIVIWTAMCPVTAVAAAAETVVRVAIAAILYPGSFLFSFIENESKHQWEVAFVTNPEGISSRTVLLASVSLPITEIFTLIQKLF